LQLQPQPTALELLPSPTPSQAELPPGILKTSKKKPKSIFKRLTSKLQVAWAGWP
ncbi:hypothetical protein HaLaN_24434, partial [Haematococcus lacustris]